MLEAICCSCFGFDVGVCNFFFSGLCFYFVLFLQDMLWNSGLLWRLSDKKILCFLPPLESGSHLMFLKL